MSNDDEGSPGQRALRFGDPSRAPNDPLEWEYTEESPQFAQATRYVAWVKGSGHAKTSRALYRVEPSDSAEAPYEQDRVTENPQSTPKRGLVAAVARTLEAMPELSAATIHTKGDYIIGALMRGDLNRWESNDWKKSDNQPVAASDIWRRIARLIPERQLRIQVFHAQGTEATKIDRLGRGKSRKL